MDDTFPTMLNWPSVLTRDEMVYRRCPRRLSPKTRGARCRHKAGQLVAGESARQPPARLAWAVIARAQRWYANAGDGSAALRQSNIRGHSAVVVPVNETPEAQRPK